MFLIKNSMLTYWSPAKQHKSWFHMYVTATNDETWTLVLNYIREINLFISALLDSVGKQSLFWDEKLRCKCQNPLERHRLGPTVQSGSTRFGSLYFCVFSLKSRKQEQSKLSTSKWCKPSLKIAKRFCQMGIYLSVGSFITEHLMFTVLDRKNITVWVWLKLMKKKVAQLFIYEAKCLI